MRLPQSSVLALMLLLSGFAFGCGGGEEPAAEATSGDETTVVAMPEPAPSEPPPEPVAPPPAPSAESPAAQPADATPQMPPFAAIIMHDVKDYDAWRTAFDGHADARKGAGLVGEAVMRGVDNDKTVLIYAPASDADKAKAFFADKELGKTMKEAGVKGKPTIYLFKMVNAKMPMNPSGDVYGAVLKYDVKDFDAFKAAIEGGEAARSSAGLIGWGLGQSVDKPTDAIVYLQSNDVEKLKGYLAAKETKAAMKDAGAKGQPKTTVVKEVSHRMYE
jgi:hypothetical protein